VISGGFLLKSIAALPKGSEVFDSYGVKSNSRFLLNYGFVEPQNVFNEYEFGLKFDSRFPLYTQKIWMFPNLKNAFIGFKLTQNYDSESFSEFMGFLRFAAIKDEEELDFVKVRF